MAGGPRRPGDGHFTTDRLPMADEVASLAAGAPHLTMPHLTLPLDQVWLLGFSSGAHLTALATLADDSPSQSCPYEAGEIAGMIRLAGPYDLDLHGARVFSVECWI